MDGHTASHVIVCIVQLKCQLISNINCCDSFGNTALHLASVNNRKQVVIVLLQAGADATLHNARSTLLYDLSHLSVLFLASCVSFSFLAL